MIIGARYRKIVPFLFLVSWCVVVFVLPWEYLSKILRYPLSSTLLPPSLTQRGGRGGDWITQRGGRGGDWITQRGGRGGDWITQRGGRGGDWIVATFIWNQKDRHNGDDDDNASHTPTLTTTTNSPIIGTDATKADRPSARPPQAGAAVSKPPVATSPPRETPYPSMPAPRPPVATSPPRETPYPSMPAPRPPVATSPPRETPYPSMPAPRPPVATSPPRETPYPSMPAPRPPVATSPPRETPYPSMPAAKPPVATSPPPRETPMPVLFKKDFDKLPRWDFEDVYRRDGQPMQTTCPQSVRRSADQSFMHSFIPDVRLFMHKNHLNVSEWNRLSHFNNPFGFMEYQYEDVKVAVGLIPEPKRPLLVSREPAGCVRCAVVGNGGILNGSGMGAEIDAHEFVFRMNGAVTRGFEQDVGNRTSVYVHTAHSITTSLWYWKPYGFDSVPHDEGIKYVLIPEGMRDLQWLTGLLNRTRVSAGPYEGRRPWTSYAGQFDEDRFYVLHPDFLRYVRNRFLRSSTLNTTAWSLVRPSNGAFTLFLALHTCDVVDAYGFMTEDYAKYPNYYVEREKTKVVFYVNHDYILEMKTWKRFHDTGVIRLYQRT